MSKAITDADRAEIRAMVGMMYEALLGGLHLPFGLGAVVDKIRGLAEDAAQEHPEAALRRLRAMREVIDEHKPLLDRLAPEPAPARRGPEGGSAAGPEDSSGGSDMPGGSPR